MSGALLLLAVLDGPGPQAVAPDSIPSAEAVGSVVVSGGASAVIALDTTAPHVTLGAVGGAEAGALLQVTYAADEPVARAFLRRGPRRSELTVLADRFEVALPPDWPDGPADVEVRDDVGNAATLVAAVAITGVTGSPVAPRPGPVSSSTYTAPPRRRAQPERRTLRLRATVGAASRTTVAVAVVAPRRVATTSAVVVHATVPLRARGARTTSGARTMVALSSATVTRAEVTALRRDGRSLDEALLLGLFD